MNRICLAAFLFLLPSTAAAQQIDTETPGGEGVLRVFLDCRTNCDFDHFRRTIDYVDWVLDPQDAQVQILVTRRITGVGGREYTLAFIGLQEFAQVRDTLVRVTNPTNTEAEIRDALTQTLELGIVAFIARSPSADLVKVSVIKPELQTSGAPADDWNSWILRFGVGGSLYAETRTRAYSLYGSATANRTTESKKTELSLGAAYAESSFELGDGSTTKGIRQEWDGRALQVYSLGGHWSAGGRLDAGHSLYRNLDLTIGLAPAIEYSVYPYAESTHRQLTILYTIGPQYFDYQEITIFGETSETRFSHALLATLSYKQPWGSSSVGLEAFQFLHDPSRHRLEVLGSLTVRLVRGLEFFFLGSFARVKDQISLRAGEATDEEILLRIRELGTDYLYDLEFGLSYRFGSIYNNVVNPRFEVFE